MCSGIHACQQYYARTLCGYARHIQRGYTGPIEQKLYAVIPPGRCSMNWAEEPYLCLLADRLGV